MPVRNTIQYLLINNLNISKKEAKEALETGTVTVNKISVFNNCYFEKTDEVAFNGKLLFEPLQVYKVLYYKPFGVECTLNTSIPGNLANQFIGWPKMFPVGRLDKASEGLLILTNSGKFYRQMNHHGSEIEKEYIVRVNKKISGDFEEKMSAGIHIMGKKTLPCNVNVLHEDTFRIILKQGLNRQIRRMCYKLDYEVLSLKRIRFGDYHIGNMQPNDCIEI